MNVAELPNRRSAYQRVLLKLRRQATETSVWQFVGVAEAYTAAQDEIIHEQAEEIAKLQARLQVAMRLQREAGDERLAG